MNGRKSGTVRDYKENSRINISTFKIRVKNSILQQVDKFKLFGLQSQKKAFFDLAKILDDW